MSDFSTAIRKSNNEKLLFKTCKYPLLSLFKMMETTDINSNYLAIVKNFLFVSFEVAAMKDIMFKEGELPFLPLTCPTSLSG